MFLFCKPQIITAVLELTLKCNAKCIHCGSSAGIDRKNNLTYEETLSIVKQLSEQKCKLISLIGGEYFLYPYWRELLIDIQKLSIPATIITNGLLLTEKKLDFIKSTNLKAIGFSIDGATPSTHNSIRQVPNCLENALKMANLCLKKDINFGAITTIHKQNISELKAIRQLLLQNKFSTWQLQHASIFGRMKEKLSLNDFEYYITGIFCAQSKILCQNKMHILGMHCMGYYSSTIPQHTANRYWTGCRAGKKTIGIRSDGKVFGCLSLYDDKYIEGDLKENTLKEILEKKSFCSWNNRLTKLQNIHKQCQNCPFALTCLGGCTSFAKDEPPKCYYAIEKHLKSIHPQSDFEKIFKSITLGKMDKNGYFYLQDNTKITNSYINKLNLSLHQKEVLSIIALD